MPEPERLRPSHVIRLVKQADDREFTLFLGAGASKSSGIPLASEMIQEWRDMLFSDNAPSGAKRDEWCKSQPWYGQEDEYSTLFEMIFPNERARQKYVEPKIEKAFPGWCYLYLADIVKSRKINVIFTTNFDDLINEALTKYLRYNPVVCAADSEVLSISILTERAKIIKLHGDYLFKQLKNTKDELKQLDPNMQNKFIEFARQCGLVVIGYAGRDQSVMSVFESLMKDENSFPNGVYWGLRPGEDAAPRVRELADGHPKRFQLFECADFDLFMSGLHSALNLSLPETVLQPYEALKESFGPLLKLSDEQLKDSVMKENVERLEQELNRSWAKADRSDFDLLEAQMALGKRDYKTAIERVSEYCKTQPTNATALTTWGDALAMRGEEEQSPAAFEEAAAKWTEAIRTDPQALPPRYSLARYYARIQKKEEAIAVSQELLKLVPNDNGLRRNLVNLYGTSGRSNEALEQVNWLLTREPNAGDLHALKAMVLEQRGLIAEALEETQRAVELDPKNAGYHFALANSFVRQVRLDEAADEFSKAIELEPNNLGYRLQIVNFYWMRGQPEFILPHVQAAVQIEPNSAEARGWLGQIYIFQGRIADAQRETEAALKLSPKDSRALVNAGIVYLRLNRLDLAEQYLKQAADVNPSNPQPYLHLCFLYWRLHRDQDLQAALQRLFQLAPQFAQNLNMQLQEADMRFGGNREMAANALQGQATPWMQQQPNAQPQPWAQQQQQGQTSQPSLSDLFGSVLKNLSA